MGNIAHTNDEATRLIYEENNGSAIIALLDLDLNLDDTDAEMIQFSTVRGGLLCNYFLGNEEICKTALEHQLMQRIHKVIQKCENNELFLLHILPVLGVISEQVSDLNFDPEINILLINILKTCTNAELAETILDLLSYQAENDDIKLLLAKSGLCDILYDRIKDHINLTKDKQELENVKTLLTPEQLDKIKLKHKEKKSVNTSVGDALEAND